MARFSGYVGYAETIETSTDVYEEVITKRKYYGDIVKTNRRLVSGESVNNDISINDSISIVADAYATDHFYAMRYVEWMGANWVIQSAEVQRPRIILSLGGLYHGKTT